MSETTDERFPPSGSSRLVGVLSLAAVAAIVVGAVTGSVRVEVALGAVVIGALIWAYNVRPSLRIVGDALILRNPFDTVRIPLVAVEDVRVSYYLIVRSGERRDTCPAISRPRRQVTASLRGDANAAAGVYPDLVESKIMQRAREMRVASGVELFTPAHEAAVADARRTWAWPEVVALVGSTVAFVVAVVV